MLEDFFSKKKLIVPLFLGFFLLFPLISDAAILMETHQNILWADEPSPGVVANGGVDEDGVTITDVTDSIYIEGRYKGYAVAHECAPEGNPPPEDSGDHDYFEWKNLPYQVIEYRIDGGSWEWAGQVIDQGTPSPTQYLDDCAYVGEAQGFESELGTYSLNILIDLPQDGSWHTLIVRSRSIGAWEQEENNITYDFQMQDTGKPDLETYGASVAHDPVYVGDTTNFDFIIENIGDAEVGLEPSIHCYLNGSEFDSGHSDDLDPGTVDWTWCQERNIGPAGNYTFEACVDDDEEVDEWDENNNCDSTTFTVLNNPISVTLTANPTSVSYGNASTLTWTPLNATSCLASSVPSNINWNSSKSTSGSQSTGNLTADTVFTLTCTGPGGTGFDTATVTVGGQIGNITVSGTNNGSTWSGSTNYRLLGPTTINGTSVSTTHSNLEGGLWTLSYLSGGPSESYWSSITPSVTQTLTNGATLTYYLNFLTSPQADLLVPSGPTPDIVDIVVGDNVQFTAGIRNSGQAAVPSGTNFNVRFNMDGGTFSNKTVNSLGVGSTVSRTSSAWTATLGSHTIQACADLPTSIVSESNENNNCRSVNISVSVYVPPQCSDGIDNDGDTWIDAEDPGCWTEPGNPGSYNPEGTVEVNIGEQCSDGLDNDGDGFIDGDDPNCEGPEGLEADIIFEEF